MHHAQVYLIGDANIGGARIGNAMYDGQKVGRELYKQIPMKTYALTLFETCLYSIGTRIWTKLNSGRKEEANCQVNPVSCFTEKIRENQ